MGVATAIASGLRRALPDAQVRIRPMADGGEGTIDAMATGDATIRRITVSDAAGGQRITPIAVLGARPGHGAPGKRGKTDEHADDDAEKPADATARHTGHAGHVGHTLASAVIESAEVVGITDAAGMRIPVAQRTTTGIGEAILAVLDGTGAAHGDAAIERVFVALGGSSTNDGGAGMLVALGARLFDAEGETVPPVPAAFDRLARIDLSGLDPRLATLDFVAMSDVDNPLCGEHGATAIFGPQKGVTPDQVGALDAALSRFADCLEQAAGRSARTLPGSGAAGGLGYALLMLGATFRPGAEVVADNIGLDTALADADWLITGEGRSDAQTLRGKAPFVACRRARAAGVATTLLSGAIDRNSLDTLGRHFAGCLSIAPGPITLDDAIRTAGGLLSDAAEQLARVRYSR